MSNNNSSGVNSIYLLGVAFIVLKLTSVIDWSWWWVTVPFWGGIALLLIGIGLYLCIKKIAERGIPKVNHNTMGRHEPKKSKFQQRLEDAESAIKQ
jgi:phosphoglycerol transferase MdoB-like AlkP superfamily enzyme